MLLKRPAAEVFKCSKRYRVVVSGRRAGKSRLICAEVARAVTKPNSVTWCIYPTYRMSRQILWSLLKQELPREWISKINETDLSIYLVNKSVVSLRGSDNPDSLRGSALDYAFLDEFDYFINGNKVWEEVIRPMLSTTLGKAMFVGSPAGHKDLYRLFNKGQDPKNLDWASFSWTTAEGGWVSLDEINAARKDLDAKTFRQEYEATFETMSGRVYYAFDRRHNVKDQPKDIKPVAVGIDFNVGSMSGVIIGETGTETYVLDVIKIKGSNTQELIQEIRYKYPAIKDAYPDPSGRHGTTNAPVGQSDHSLLKQAGFRVICKGQVSVRDGINAVNSRLCTIDNIRRLFISPKAASMISALEQHCYKQNTSQPDKSDEWNHELDALRYYIDYVYPVKSREAWIQ